MMAAVLTACAASAKRETLPDVVWPSPPEVPRYKLVRVLKGEADYAKEPSWFQRVFLGAKKPSQMRHLSNPLAVACHPKRNVVYAYDAASHLIYGFDEEKEELKVYGNAPMATLRQCAGVAVDEKDVVYASDSLRKRVFAYAPDGTLLRTYGQKAQSSVFAKPTGVAVDLTRNRLYVADTAEHVVRVLAIDSGKLLATWGRRGQGLGELNFPTFLATDRSGNLVVSDTMNFRYQVFAPDGSPIRTVGSVGDRPGNFFRLKGLGLDSEGHVYAVDAAFANVQVFDGAGALLLVVGQSGQSPGEFTMPTGVCVTPDDTVWISDRFAARLQGIRYLRNAHIPSHAAPASQPASAPVAPIAEDR